MGRERSKFKDNTKDMGRFIQLPVVVLECQNYISLGYPAKALLVELARQFTGMNNGRLLLSMKFLKKYGWNSSDVVSRAKNELIEAGFIYETVKGHRPNKASWYAVTWRVLDKIDGYDHGAEKYFIRSAYTQPPIKIKNLNPSNGLKHPPIAPSGGVKTSPSIPLGGAIKALNIPPVNPPSGNHIYIPSTP
jgi:hypothetical protein